MPPLETAYTSAPGPDVMATRPLSSAISTTWGSEEVRSGRCPDLPGAVVAEQVPTRQVGDRGAPDDGAAGDRAASVGVGVDEHGAEGAVDRLVVVEPLEALERAPSEVRALGPLTTRRSAPTVDLLEVTLADVTDPQVAGIAVEREAPGVAQSVRPDLGSAALVADERVVGAARRTAAALGRVDRSAGSCRARAQRSWRMALRVAARRRRRPRCTGAGPARTRAGHRCGWCTADRC